jgi:hypothetical protein
VMLAVASVCVPIFHNYLHLVHRVVV